MHRYFANNHEMENVNQLIENNRDDTAKKAFHFTSYCSRTVFFIPFFSAVYNQERLILHTICALNKKCEPKILCL